MHSCLSPCAEDEMTPFNMVGMAKVLGLDVIAITDHNCTLNAPAAIAAGELYGIKVIPGMEITSREEVHMLAYFSCLADALEAGAEVYDHLPDIRNKSELFGNQIIVNEEDEPCGTKDKLLLSATDLSLSALSELAEKHHGLLIPAHINRGNNGMIGALGLMPFLPEYPVVETYRGVDCPAYATKGRFLLHSSDAHRLEDIQERISKLDTDAENVFEYLKDKCESGRQ